MTDPATLAPGELAEAVMRELGWEPANYGVLRGDWIRADGTSSIIPLDFHSEAERWRSFGVVHDNICSGRGMRWRGWVDIRESAYVEVFDSVHENARGFCLAQCPADLPAALAVAFLRASAQDGGAG